MVQNQFVNRIKKKMKLLRVGEKGKEKPAILDKNNKIRDLIF